VGEALNELAAADWELQHLVPLSLPETDKFAAEKWIATGVLVNRSLGKDEDIQRQREKLKTEIGAAQRRRDAIPEVEAIKRTIARQDIEALTERLERLGNR
ncbi:MAG: hypothetical protein ACRD1R_05715, partial [Acidobacteriota bacterium]